MQPVHSEGPESLMPSCSPTRGKKTIKKTERKKKEIEKGRKRNMYLPVECLPANWLILSATYFFSRIGQRWYLGPKESDQLFNTSVAVSVGEPPSQYSFYAGGTLCYLTRAESILILRLIRELEKGFWKKGEKKKGKKARTHARTTLDWDGHAWQVSMYVYAVQMQMRYVGHGGLFSGAIQRYMLSVGHICFFIPSKTKDVGPGCWAKWSCISDCAYVMSC